MKSLIIALLVSTALAAPCMAQVTTLYRFSGATDGENPHAGVIYHGGALYGTTGFGGTSQYGTVFRIDAGTGAETVLHRFGGGADGANPFGGLLYFGGALYGTSWSGGGGTCDCGTVFKVDPVSGANSVLHVFGGTDGEFPVAALIYHAGALYGSTSQGGARNAGTVFSIDPASGALRTLHSFGGFHGRYPFGGLVYAAGGLYGTASAGGASGNGVVFRVRPDSGAETVLHSFATSGDGRHPEAGLTLYRHVLYGTTRRGGEADMGAVFKVDPATGAESVLHSFDGTDGRLIEAGLAAHGGMLYGAGSFGGTRDQGTLYEINPMSGAFSVLYDFASGDGILPNAVMFHAGTLYGTTDLSGADETFGTVFSMTP
jgi:uncharacterized repeat protein (TIGR03803 family)